MAKTFIKPDAIKDSSIAFGKLDADLQARIIADETAISDEEAARKAHIGDLGKVSEEEGAADHTVKSYVDAAIAGVNGDAEALEGRVDDIEDALDVIGGDTDTEGSIAYAVKAEADRVDAKIGDLGKQTLPEDAEEGAVAADHTVKSYVDAKVAEINGDADALEARVKANEDALVVINGDATTDGSIKKAAADAVAEVLDDAPEAFDTLKEIAEWIAADAENENGFDAANRIVKLETAVGAPASGEGDDAVAASGLYKVIDDKVAAINSAADDLDERVDTLEDTVGDSESGLVKGVADNAAAIAKLNGADTEEGSVAKAVKDEADRVDAKIGALGKVSEEEGAADHTVKSYVDAAIDAVNGAADDLEDRVADLEDALDTINGDDETDGSIAKAVKDSIDALEADFTGDDAAKSTDGHVTVSLTQEAGKITALTVATDDIASASDLSDLSDLVGTAGDTAEDDTVFGAIAKLDAKAADAYYEKVDILDLDANRIAVKVGDKYYDLAGIMARVLEITDLEDGDGLVAHTDADVVTIA